MSGLDAPAVLVVGGALAADGGPVDVLRRGGFAVVVARTFDEARARLAVVPADLVLTDLRLPDGSGLELIGLARQQRPGMAVAVVADGGAVEDAVTAMKLGAVDFLTAPCSPASLLDVADRALGRRDAPARSRSADVAPAPGLDLSGLTVREMERRLIADTLRRTGNNRTQAAKLLGISIRTLRNKLAEYRARDALPLAPEPGF